jgi:FtsZ-interacting cell division protein ZipA
MQNLDYLMIIGIMIVIAILMNRFHEVKERRERAITSKPLEQ